MRFGAKLIKVVIGLALIALAIGGVVAANWMTAPRYYDVVVASAEIPAYTPVQEAMAQGWLGVQRQSFPDQMKVYYVLQDELGAMQDGVIVESLRAGEPLMRVNVATGENKQRVRRLSVALTEPGYGIVRVPVDSTHVPKLYYGDIVDIYATFGAVRASSLITEVVVDPALVLTETQEVEGAVAAGGAEETPAPLPATSDLEESEAFTRTFEAEMPVTMRVVSHALVVRLNYKMIPNPQYGAGDQSAPPYIEGGVESVDLLVEQPLVEELNWAILNGQMSLVLRPAVAGAAEEPETPGFTWSDFEKLFWTRRQAVEEAWEEAGLEPPGKEP